MHAKPVNDQKDQPEEEVLDFTKPDFEFRPGMYHEWRQQGPFLVCKSCEVQHAVHIGMNKILVGFDKDLKPILKARKLSPG